MVVEFRFGCKEWVKEVYFSRKINISNKNLRD